MKKGTCISNIFWDRIFLNIEIENMKDNKIYLVSKDQLEIVKLDLDRVDEKKSFVKINITNIGNAKMLSDNTYSFAVKEGNNYKEIPITIELGYKLESLDKIYRYKVDYAYTVNFEAKISDENNIVCILKSRYMQSMEGITIKKKIKIAKAHILKSILQAMYTAFSCLHPNKQNKILLMSETRSPISGNLKALNERIIERKINEKYKISYYFSKTLESHHFSLIFKWMRLIWLVSKQELIFIDDYSPLYKYINLSKKTKLIQVWHAGVGFKSVGYARFGFGGPQPFTSCHRKYDYAIVGGKALIEVYEEVFGIDKEKILPYGLPRLDGYLNEDRISSIKEKLYIEYPELNNKKVILFAPTYRGQGQKTAYYPYEKLDLEKIFNMCENNDYIFLIKMHPFIREKINIPEKYKKRIKDFSDYKEINDLLYITDILITDYSSNIYDFSLLNRPIIFYTFDLDEYQLIHKVHRPIKEYAPGKVCITFDEVICAINNNDFEVEKLSKFRRENFDDYEDSACDLIIDNIILKGEK